MDASRVWTKPADKESSEGAASLAGTAGRLMPWKRQNSARSLEVMDCIGRTQAACPGPSLHSVVCK